MKIVRVPALTGLRFVAAMMVLIGHGLYAAHFAADTMTSRILDPLPSMGMTLFFVLSGFVMWVNYAQSFRVQVRFRRQPRSLFHSSAIPGRSASRCSSICAFRRSHC